MNSLEANIRSSQSIGNIKKIRNSGFVPGILYGGKSENQKISVSKKKFEKFNGKRKLFVENNKLKD